MTQWAVAEFVSRVAGRVTTAGEDLASGLVERGSDEFLSVGGAYLQASLVPVEPSPEFVIALRQKLMDAPMVDAGVDAVPDPLDRRVIYGVAFGSLASAAVAAMFYLRYRAVRRAA